jgi:hypothetical protein
VTPDDLGYAILIRGAIQNIDQVVPRADDNFGARFDKPVVNQLHSSSATIAHSGRMAMLSAVMPYFNRGFSISSQKSTAGIFHLCILLFYVAELIFCRVLKKGARAVEAGKTR